MARGRIARKFAELRTRNEAALIPFVIAGDPDLEHTELLLREMDRRGADLIELGVPFSDPMADGPANQRSAARALASNASLPQILSLVSRLREHTQVPIVLFGYYNPLLRYGCDRLCTDAATAGVDGLLAIDLPHEEASELAKPARGAGLDLIYLVAPTTPLERSRKIAKLASGFLYYVSVTGITGARNQVAADVEQHVNELRQVSKLPVAVGFGISTPDHARQVAAFADAVVVGSAISLIIEANGRSPKVVSEVGDFVGSLKDGMRGARVGARTSAAG
jgi:tryptophan synthase alpha chain